MTRRPEIVAVMAALAIGTSARASSAQPNLPPPPPPPIGESNDVPSLPPPPPPSSQRPAALPRRTAPAQAPPTTSALPPAPPPYRANPRNRRADDVVYVEPDARQVAITLNPVGLYWGRLSANVEVQVAPHHALVLSPNALAVDASRGGPHDVVSEGLGFASRSSRSFGVELGYHYWWDWARELRGPFFGPSLLLGSTTLANVGDPTHGQSYWGLALDFGWQEVLASGFTAGAGGGVEVVHMAGTSGVVPRFLLQLGWSL